MVKYLVIYASYIESEGLEASTFICDTEEQARDHLKREYDYLMKSFKESNTMYVFDCNIKDEDGYSISCSNIYGYEKYEAYISRMEVK